MHAISTAATTYDIVSLDLVLHPFNKDAYAHGSLDTHTHVPHIAAVSRLRAPAVHHPMRAGERVGSV